MVDASRSQHELDDAEQRLRSLNADDKAGFHLALAGLSLRKNDRVSAASAMKHALSLDPNSIEAHLALAKLYWLENDLTNADREFKAAAELAPVRSAARLIYAEFKARTGALDEAKTLLREITREVPDSLSAWRILAQIAFTEKKLDESLTLIENILLRDPANIEARVLQAQVWLAKGEIKKAIESLERLDTAYPELPLIQYTLARAYLQNNNAAQATVVLNQVLAANPDNPEALLLLGEANRSSNPQQVVASMLDLLKKRPDLAQAQVVLARAYQSLGRLEDAATVFREQIKISPQSSQPYLLLGLILRQQNKIDEARKAFENAQQLAPENLLAFSLLVDLDIESRDFVSALQRVHAQLQKTPQSPAAHFLEGKVYAAQGQLDRAEAALLKTLELDRNSSSAYDLLTSIYVAANKLPQAITQLNSLLAESPENPRALLMLSALTYEKMDEFAKARDAYEKLLSAKPDVPPVLNNLAYLYAERLNELDKARDLAQKARALQPGDGAIADTLGWILYKRGDYKQALALLQESAEDLPNNPEIQLHLGMANYMMGRTDEARTAFRQAAAAPVDFPGKEEAKRQLSLLGDVESKEKQLSSNESQNPTAAPSALAQPDDPLTQVRLGESYEKQGVFAQAAAAYEKAIELNPNLLAATAKLAQLYAGPLQDNEKGLRFARKARELAPNDPKIVGILGRVAYQNGNFTWAYSLLQESSRQLPDDAEMLYDFAWAAYSLGKVGEARQAMQRVLRAATDSSRSSDAKLFLAMTVPDQEGANPIAAESEVDRALEANPDYVPALMAQAAILFKRGESETAATIYSEVLRRFPDFAPALKRLASLYAEDPEKRDQAYKLVIKARKALPDDPELAQILAELSYQRKEFAYAAQLLRRSSEKRPLDAKHLYYLGMSYLKADEKLQSQEALRQALAAGLPDPLASETKSVLAELEKE